MTIANQAAERAALRFLLPLFGGVAVAVSMVSVFAGMALGTC
jgi:hypothetical protein